MIGVQFADIGGAEKSLTNVFKLDETFAGYNDDYKFATQMRIWTGNGYDYYGWAGTSGTDIDGEEYAYLDNTWTDLEAYEVEGVFMAPASGAWVIAEKTGTLTIAGEVALNDVTINLEEGYNIVCNPFPCEVSITNFGVLDETYAGYNDDYKFATQMRVWTGNGYDYYGWAGTSGTDIDGEEYAYLDNTWTDLEAYEVDGKIKPGEAVWIIAEKAGTITFKAPTIK